MLSVSAAMFSLSPVSFLAAGRGWFARLLGVLAWGGACAHPAA